MPQTQKQILHKELSYKLGGLFYKTHDTLGRFAREKQYADLFERLLQEAGISYEREKIISKTGDDLNRADFIIENSIVIEFKVKPFITREDYYQIKRYLEREDLLLGIIPNFRSSKNR